MGVVSYSTEISLDFSLSEYSNIEDVAAAIWAIPWMAGYAVPKYYIYTNRNIIYTKSFHYNFVGITIIIQFFFQRVLRS